MPRVSIITPCYNAAPFIEEAIQSVRKQTFTDWEHVVVDDGSTDDSAHRVAAMTKDSQGLQLVRQPNGGVCSARNAGFAASSGDCEYLLFLDADDYIKPRMLEVLVQHMDAHPEVGMTFCKTTEVDERGTQLAGREHLHLRYAPASFDVCTLHPEHLETPLLAVLHAFNVVPPTCASLVRGAVYEQTTGFDEDLGQGCEDKDLFLQVALRSTIHFLDEELAYYRRHPDQDTARRQSFKEQHHKYFEKWKNPQGLTRQQEKALQRALCYWRSRIIPRVWWAAGIDALRRGRVGKGLLFCVGAVTRYIFSPLSLGWGLTGPTYAKTPRSC